MTDPRDGVGGTVGTGVHPLKMSPLAPHNGTEHEPPGLTVMVVVLSPRQFQLKCGSTHEPLAELAGEDAAAGAVGTGGAAGDGGRIGVATGAGVVPGGGLSAGSFSPADQLAHT